MAMARQLSLASNRNASSSGGGRIQSQPTPVSLHILALKRGLLFAAALISLVVPMAVAAWRGDAELSLARSWPLELSAGRDAGISFSTPGPGDISR
jgi:hypothetical protein